MQTHMIYSKLAQHFLRKIPRRHVENLRLCWEFFIPKAFLSDEKFRQGLITFYKRKEVLIRKSQFHLLFLNPKVLWLLKAKIFLWRCLRLDKEKGLKMRQKSCTQENSFKHTMISGIHEFPLNIHTRIRFQKLQIK